MVGEDTLRVKNLPKELTDAEKEEFLIHFGAVKVKVITSKAKQKSTVFAKFESKEVAKEVLLRLHQTYILKNRLCVEYADHDIGLPNIKVEQTNPSTNNKEHLRVFINKLQSFNHSVEFQQPPPPYLKYVYPKANAPTINNIGHALATIPKFYTQVLHLMNRMNLPPPFVLTEPKRAALAAVAKPKTSPVQPKQSSSESELESDEDSQKNPEIIPQKRTLPQKKGVKRPKFIKPTPAIPGTSATSSKGTEEAFEKSDVHKQRKIELKVSASLSVNPQEEPDRIMEADEKQSDPESDQGVITLEKLLANQIPAKDLDVIPVFKNYHPGPPTTRLYIKNIAKNADLKDLEFIYNRYKEESEAGDKVNEFEIKLMQEGRMKGQAFVTFASVELAQKALKETNGFILKDKPLVVVFARSTSVKKQ